MFGALIASRVFLVVAFLLGLAWVLRSGFVGFEYESRPRVKRWAWRSGAIGLEAMRSLGIRTNEVRDGRSPDGREERR